MSYVQIEPFKGGFLARGLELDPRLRIGGYPGYAGEFTSNRGSVRTIVYKDSDGRIYTTEDKQFLLVNVTIDGNPTLIFTANTNVPHTNVAGTVHPWRDEWANMKTDAPTRNGLIWPFDIWQEAWTYIAQREPAVPVSFYRWPKEGVPWDGAWIAGVDIFGIDKIQPIALSWWPRRTATFNLLKRGDYWALRFLGDGVVNGNESIFNDLHHNPYVGDWREYDAHRWIFTGDNDKTLLFSARHLDPPPSGELPSAYHLYSVDNKRLNQAGSWSLGGIDNIDNGVEFFNGNDNPEFDMNILAIINNLTDTERYRLRDSKYFELRVNADTAYKPYNPTAVIANLPGGGSSCPGGAWDGTHESCWPYGNAYTPTIGRAQCTTLDDFEVDQHCQQWAIDNASNEKLTLMTNLCSTQEGQDVRYASTCKCFYPLEKYAQEISARHKGNPAVTAALRTTGQLQCSSGLCMQEGEFSDRLFYREGRRCDICVQAINADINVTGNVGPINFRQKCLADISHTWPEFVSRLETMGAYRIGVGGLYRNILINEGATAIKLNASTIAGKNAIAQLTALASLPRDSAGNVTITREQWRSNAPRYSEEILIFMIDTAET